MLSSWRELAAKRIVTPASMKIWRTARWCCNLRIPEAWALSTELRMSPGDLSDRDPFTRYAPSPKTW
jgi:hypothetical protein